MVTIRFAVSAALGLALAGGLIVSGHALAAEPSSSSPPKDARTVYDSSTGAVVPAPTETGAVGRGYLVYEKWCAGCHDPDPARQTSPGGPGGGLEGRVFSGTYTLQQKYKGALPAALVQRKDLTGGDITARVRDGYNVMPRFRKTEITDADLAAVIAYLTRNNPK